MTKQKMDHQVDKMKLSKYGCRLNLLRFSFILSVLGIGVSITGIIGGIAAIVRGSKLESGKISNFFTELTRGGKNYQAKLGVLLLDRSTMYVIGGVLLLFMIQYLILWILLSSSSRQASKTFLALNNW